MKSALDCVKHNVPSLAHMTWLETAALPSKRMCKVTTPFKWNCRTEERKLSGKGFYLAQLTLSPGTWAWATWHSVNTIPSWWQKRVSLFQRVLMLEVHRRWSICWSPPTKHWCSLNFQWASIPQHYSESLTDIRSVHSALNCGVTFGASSAKCENTFSTLTNVFGQHRWSMLHPRQAQLMNGPEGSHQEVQQMNK